MSSTSPIPTTTPPPEAGPQPSPTLDQLAALAVAFRDARDWARFHTPKDLAANLCIEAAELLELTQWRAGEDLDRRLAEPAVREAFADELADVLLTLLLLAHDRGIDLSRSFLHKLAKNEAKYPVDRAKGRCDKYDAL
jgi:NTP pyrophosphatase (non-canonical NTP hydrolase)